MNAPSSVSKFEPAVVNVTVPVEGAAQRYQTDAPPELPAIEGSPVSFVAPTFEPVAVPDAPVTDCAFANMSFCGAV